MGREIRRVPANWEHPKQQQPWGLDYISMHNESFDHAVSEWEAGRQLWDEGKYPEQTESECESYAEWAGESPDRDYYLRYDPEDKLLCTWWQVYETVSEGSPVSPPFATAEELIDYLSTHGDFWEQTTAKEQCRKVQPYSRKAAEQFVLGDGWAPSFVVTGGKIMFGVEALSDQNDPA